MKQKISDLSVPTWIVGKENDITVNGESAGNALCLKVHPTLEAPATYINSIDFNNLIDQHTQNHCNGTNPLANNDIGSKYLLWRELLASVLGSLLQNRPVTNSRYKEVAKSLKIYKHGEMALNNNCEKDVFDYFTLLHYHKDDELPWIGLCLRKSSKIFTNKSPSFKQALTAIEDAYFSCLEIIEIKSLEQGIMTAFDLLRKKEFQLVDRALCQNAHKNRATHIIGTFVDAKDFIMNLSGGIPLDRKKETNLALLNKINQLIEKLKTSKGLSRKNHYKLTFETIKTAYKLNVMADLSVQYI
jgi:hypothetical protein